MPSYTHKQKEYIDSVEGKAHQSAVEIIGELERELIQALHDNLKAQEEINKLLTSEKKLLKELKFIKFSTKLWQI